MWVRLFFVTETAGGSIESIQIWQQMRVLVQQNIVLLDQCYFCRLCQHDDYEDDADQKICKDKQQKCAESKVKECLMHK